MFKLNAQSPPPRSYKLARQGFGTYFNGAFTLAEVLITLGIIGVIAAITIPAIINNYQKRVTVTRLKHTYSLLSQAIEQSEAINGEIINWDFSKTRQQVFETYLMPHIKGISKQNLKGSDVKYKRTSGERENMLWFFRTNLTRYTLANGTQLFVYRDNTINIPGVEILIDTNGFKGPNQFGKDVFYFVITKARKLYPMGRYSDGECQFETEPNNNRDILKKGSCKDYGCNKKSRGMWCGALIMVDNWKIAPDYPW